MARFKSLITRWALLLAVSLSALVSARAETVSQKAASQYARQFFNAANGLVMGEPVLAYNGRKLTTHSLFVPFYVYNFPGGGFVIVAAENKAFPILGYNMRQKFDPDNIDPKLKALLTSYARDIERIRYDSRSPYEAIEAWSYFPDYVRNLLRTPTMADDVSISGPEAAATVETLVENDDPEYASVTYSPDQWCDALNSELAAKRNAVVGIYDENNFIPLILHGNKGDFYLIDFDGAPGSLFRLFSTEYYSDGQVSALGAPIRITEPELPDLTFRFYDDFRAETEAERERKQKIAEDFGTISKPVVSFIGAGHFSIRCPEEITAVNLYNIGGALVNRQTFKDTDTVVVDYSIQPSGFYIALLQGKSGKIYGVKLIR